MFITSVVSKRQPRAPRPAQIAGQAVLEGIMMQGKTARALAVRDEEGEIRLFSERIPPRKGVAKIPFLRGVVNFIASLVSGMRITLKSAEVFGGDVDTDDGKGVAATMALSVIIGLALAVGLFILLPTAITQWFFNIENRVLRLLIDALIKIVIMLGYFIGISYMPDIRRVFQYHGAEHKTIACFESGEPLTVENVRSQNRFHPRCGTSFIVFVIIISIAIMLLCGVIASAAGFDAYFDKIWVRSLIKLALLPLTASISYELLMFIARTDFILFRPLKALGTAMQKITTKEPDDAMIEVAITAHQTVQAMDAAPDAPVHAFPPPVTLAEFRKSVEPLLEYKTIESSDVDWVLCAVLGLARNKLKPNVTVPAAYQIKANKMLRRCAAGEPLAYVLGHTEFYGNVFAVDKNTLIPRPETELVCEQALAIAKAAGSRPKVLDLCCGSGCIGLTIASKIKASVTLADISPAALKICRQNLKKFKDLTANIVKSDMFSYFSGKFDLIVCNPPYVKTADIETLDPNVKAEPRLALDGGEDGLDFYRIIAKDAPRHLYAGGHLVLEVGMGQAEAVCEMFASAFETDVKKDYAGIDRIVIAKLKKGNNKSS